MTKPKIKSIEKADRKDISYYVATLENGHTVGTEADTKKEAEKKITEFIENNSLEPTA